MRSVIADAGQVTPEWLTDVLREQGVLPRGAVTCVTPGKVQSAFASAVWRLEVSYSGDVAPDAPHRLFLKASNPALAPGTFDPKHLGREIVFYSEVAPAMDTAFTIPCYDVAYDPETLASHILLKDVSATHIENLSPSCQAHCEGAVDSLASLHAFWWDHPRLGKDVGRIRTHEERRQSWIEAEESTTAFMSAVGDQLPRPWRLIYESVLPALPDLAKRDATGRHLTLVHGDAHLGNFLFPRCVGEDPAYILDWQFWHPSTGGTDLAFMIATEWEPETRRHLEQTLLRRYHRRLLALGVRDYGWDDCWNDYRLSVIQVSIFIPVWRWAIFKWTPDMSALNSSMTAFEDLKCSDLLDVE